MKTPSNLPRISAPPTSLTLTLPSIGAFFLLSREASACGTCASASIWIVFPPLLYWAGIVIIWFLVWSVLSSLFSWTLIPVPRFWIAMILLGTIALFLVPMGGPIIGFPVAVLVTASWIRFAISPPSEPPIRVKRWVHGTGALAVVAMLVTAIPELISPTPREPLDVIREWPGTAASRAALSELEAGGVDSRRKIRSILQGAGEEYASFEVWVAAQSLRAANDPETDIPLLLDAYAKYYGPEMQLSDGGQLEWELKELIGVDLPTGSSPQAWRQAWDESRSEEAASPSS